jgi:hypothetical protein
MSTRSNLALAGVAAAIPLLSACLGSDRGPSASSLSSEPGSPSTTQQALARPLRFPRVANRCPASHGRYVSTPTASGIALGDGPVRVFVNNAGDLGRGRAHLASTDFPKWLALKTHFFSSPGYQGPFLVRAKRLDRDGAMVIGAKPKEAAPLLVPSGPAANGLGGWREFPYFTFVRSPGCYAWQVDGLSFSEVIVVRMLARFDV